MDVDSMRFRGGTWLSVGPTMAVKLAVKVEWAILLEQQRRTILSVPPKNQWFSDTFQKVLDHRVQRKLF